MRVQLTDKEVTELAKIADTYIYEGIFRYHLSTGGILEIINRYEEMLKDKKISYDWFNYEHAKEQYIEQAKKYHRK